MLGTISWLRQGRTLSVIGPGGLRTLSVAKASVDVLRTRRLALQNRVVRLRPD
jgi:hypothetical protein